LTADLSANYGPVAIDLAEADYGAPEQFHSGRLNPADPRAWRYTTLCFCPSCRQMGADVDFEGLLHDIHSGEPDIAQSEEISALDAMRTSSVTRLLGAVTAASSTGCWLETRDQDAHRGRPPAAIDGLA